MPQTLITIRSITNELRFAFRGAGIDTADLDARLILSHILQISQAHLISEPDLTVAAGHVDAIRSAMHRRILREPVSRIIGAKEFWGRPFEINSHTLDPRPDTEIIIEAALQIIREKLPANKEISILDLGTGSGCILLTLLAECENAWGVGVDINEAAITVAKKNSENLAVGHRAHFMCSDWTNALNGDFDIIVANPPYIRSAEIDILMPEVRNFDPLLALDGGDDGLEAYRLIIAKITTLLTSGWLIFELGIGQLNDVCQLLDQAGFGCEEVDRLILSDISGTIRTVASKQQSSGGSKKRLDIRPPKVSL